MASTTRALDDLWCSRLQFWTLAWKGNCLSYTCLVKNNMTLLFRKLSWKLIAWNCRQTATWSHVIPESKGILVFWQLISRLHDERSGVQTSMLAMCCFIGFNGFSFIFYPLWCIAAYLKQSFTSIIKNRSCIKCMEVWFIHIFDMFSIMYTKVTTNTVPVTLYDSLCIYIYI